jgi:hypothetical protein
VSLDLVDRGPVAEPAPSPADHHRDLVGVARLLRAYWWFTLPALLLTLGLAYRLPAGGHTPWEARSSLVIIDPTSQSAGEQSNPYLVGHNSLLTTATLLASAVKDDVADLKASGQLTSEVDITVPEKPPEPIVQIVVDGRDEASTSADIATVVDVTSKRLQDVQTEGDVSHDHLVTSQTVETTVPHQEASSRIRPTLGIVAIGTALTIWIVLVADRRRGRRRNERTERARS